LPKAQALPTGPGTVAVTEWPPDPCCFHDIEVCGLGGIGPGGFCRVFPLIAGSCQPCQPTMNHTQGRLLPRLTGPCRALPDHFANVLPSIAGPCRTNPARHRETSCRPLPGRARSWPALPRWMASLPIQHAGPGRSPGGATRVVGPRPGAGTGWLNRREWVTSWVILEKNSECPGSPASKTTLNGPVFPTERTGRLGPDSSRVETLHHPLYRSFARFRSHQFQQYVFDFV
jgi:hypothetical protein